MSSLLSSPAGLLAPADLSSSADHEWPTAEPFAGQSWFDRPADSACKNQLVVVNVQYGPFNTYIPIISTTIGKSRVAKDPITMHTSWRSNSDIASVTSIGYPHMKASGESSTTKHRLLHASGPHPIPPPNDPKTNQYNQDLVLIHSTNGNHLESPNEGSSIDHQVTIHLHDQNITMFPTNETWYFTSQMLVSSSGGLILILTAKSTRNVFRMHSINNKGKAQNLEELLPKSSKPTNEQPDQISQESSNEQQLCASSSIRSTASNKVENQKEELSRNLALPKSFKTEAEIDEDRRTKYSGEQ
ncbi:hypothetical protein F511_41900 [Dorcoceras hygrometricum]|uniref:Uncharacterized protein n=1 Tax=Dorcoceras hygrometricum TaxID=472368 RepID=A0A2Z7CNE2_9LAMI|nr:hypothetical protein F511_41900 [Dorcoceras hygrometricum]